MADERIIGVGERAEPGIGTDGGSVFDRNAAKNKQSAGPWN